MDNSMSGLDPWEYFKEGLSRRLAREEERVVLELFEERGYSLEKLTELSKQKRLAMISQSWINTYLVDDKALFSVEKRIEPRCARLIIREVAENESKLS